MGLVQWVVKRAVDHVVAHQSDAPEAIERRQMMRRSVRIQIAAQRYAASLLDDRAAAAALAEEIEDRGEPFRRAIEYFADPRDNFLYDRAYRLLTAVAEESAVRPIDPAVRDLFIAEERLGRLPLKDAFAWLAEREPRLRAVEREILDRGTEFEDVASRGQLANVATRRIGSLVGFNARGKGWLMRSDLAEAVVFRYLLAIAGAPGEDASRALFDHPGAVSPTILLWGLERPAAHN